MVVPGKTVGINPRVGNRIISKPNSIKVIGQNGNSQHAGNGRPPQFITATSSGTNISVRAIIPIRIKREQKIADRDNFSKSATLF
jgi:hypothetical protein